jgi:hypothetical protein
MGAAKKKPDKRRLIAASSGLKKAERPVRGRPGVRSSDRNLTFGRGTDLSGGRTVADRATVTEQMGPDMVRVNLRFFGNRHVAITYQASS